MNTIEEETVCCKKCQKQISWLAVFPKGICVDCHEQKFNEQVKATGHLPKPDFSNLLTK